MTREEVMRIVADAAQRAAAAVFTGNGYNARALSALHDRPEFYYMLGSMSLCPTLAAGFAHRTRRPTIVVEGDGNALMGLSGFPVTACVTSSPFIHIVLNNGVYETTGSQRTLAAEVDFKLLALGAGYSRVYAPDDTLAFDAVLASALQRSQRTFIVLNTSPHVGPPHPRVPYHPREVASRFRQAWRGPRSTQGDRDAAA